MQAASTFTIDVHAASVNFAATVFSTHRPRMDDKPAARAAIESLLADLRSNDDGERSFAAVTSDTACDLVMLLQGSQEVVRGMAERKYGLDRQYLEEVAQLLGQDAAMVHAALLADLEGQQSARASCDRAMVTQAAGEVVEEGRFGASVDVEAERAPHLRSLVRVRATTLGILQNIYTGLHERSDLPLQELARIEYLLTDAVEVRGVGSDVFYDVHVDGATAGLVHFILGDFLATDPVSQVPRKERRELRYWLRGMEADRTELWGVYYNSLDGPGGRSGARGLFRRR